MEDPAETKQICRSASALLYPELDFDVKPCGTYTRDDFFEVLSRIAFDQAFANTGGKTVQYTRGDDVDLRSTAHNSLAKSLLYHLRQLDADAIDAQFHGVREQLIHQATKQRLLPDVVDVAIDIHEWRFYGDEETDHVLSTYPDHLSRSPIPTYPDHLSRPIPITYPDQGTTLAFSFATVCIVTPSIRFTLDVVPLDANGFPAKRDAVRTLLESAREYVTIRHVYLDRGFYQVHVVAELLQLGVDFIVRARLSSGMKDLLAEDEETVVAEYLMQRKRPPTTSAEVTVFAVPHRSSDNEYVWFVTNLSIEEGAVRAYAAAFRRRWGIETSYRQISDFLPRTSSPTFSVRLFHFLFAVALYDLWVLANVLVAGGSVPDPPPISTKIFRLFVYPVEYG